MRELPAPSTAPSTPVAMWAEDLRSRRAPMPFVGADGAPLECFGPLPPLPAAAPGPAGPWRAPSPRAAPGDGELLVEATPASGRRRGTAILVPPWKLPRLSILSGWRALLAGAGYDVWTLVPPRHLGRAAPGTRSGEGFVSPDLPALRRVFEQLVLELRMLAALARRRPGQVGMVGLSLGGLATLLAATAPEPLDLAVAVGPPADFAAVFARTRIGRRYLQLATAAGAPPPPPAALATMLAPFRPETRRPTARRVLVAVGTEDRIALPEAALALARAWGAEARSHPRGHLTLLFACDDVRREVLRFATAEAAC